MRLGPKPHRRQPSSAFFTLAANSSVCDFSFDRMKLSMIRASRPFACTDIVYVTFVAFPRGARSIVPTMSMLSDSPRNRPCCIGTCSIVSVRTTNSWESGPILTLRFQRARFASRTSTDCTPGTQLPTRRMSERNVHTRSIGAATSNETVPSGMVAGNTPPVKYFSTNSWAREDCGRGGDPSPGQVAGSEDRMLRYRGGNEAVRGPTSAWSTSGIGGVAVCDRRVPDADAGPEILRGAVRLLRTEREKGRGPPPCCLGGWGSREWTQPFRRNGRPVRLFTPIFRFFGISSIGLPLFGFRLLKK